MCLSVVGTVIGLNIVFGSSKYHQGVVVLFVRRFIPRDKHRSDSLQEPKETTNLF